MSKNLHIEIEGIEELASDFRRFGKQAKDAIKRGVDRTALAVETDAKEKLKSDGHIITGRLRSSLHAETVQGQQFGYRDDHGETYNGALNEKIGELDAVAGTNVHYAPYIEFGTKYITADSYLGYAAIKQDKKLKDRVIEELNKLLK